MAPSPKQTSEKDGTAHAPSRSIFQTLAFGWCPRPKDGSVEEPSPLDKAKAKAREDLAARAQEEREERRQAVRERAHQKKEGKKRREAEEKRVQNQFAGGLCRGYDPSAGRLRKPSDDDESSILTEPSVAANPPLTLDGLLTPKPHCGHTWGIEIGRSDIARVRTAIQGGVHGRGHSGHAGSGNFGHGAHGGHFREPSGSRPGDHPSENSGGAISGTYTGDCGGASEGR